MARFSEAELDRLKSSVALVALIEASGVKLTQRGRDHVGLCPFHEDREPSLSVSAEKNLWRCFGCDAGGDAIAFVMKREGVSFRHAVELLRADWAPDAGAAPVTQSTVRKLDFEPAPEDRALLGQVLDYYHATLTESPEALAYLEKRGQTGAAFTGGQGGANGQVATMRIMDPNPSNPSGYIKYENAPGPGRPQPQGVDPYSGRTVRPEDAHHPIDR